MAIKSAIGKNVTLSKPAAGTLKPISLATNGVGIQPSKQLRAESDSMDRVDNAPPAEIVAISDFNRIYTSGTRGGRSAKTQYGRYYDALKSIHSIATEDVAYIVSKALENDTSGQWERLRSALENDAANAKDLVDDLGRFLNSLERAERALDFGRDSDEELTAASVEFLSQRVKSYERKIEERKFDAKSILRSNSSTGAGLAAGISTNTYENDSNTDLLKKMLNILREALTHDDVESYDKFLKGVSQKSQNDLNNQENKTAWEYIDSLPSSTTDRVASCAELVSHVLSLSTGIQKVQEDPVSEKIAFKPTKLNAIFRGIENRAIPGQSLGPAPFPFTKKLSIAGPPSSTVSLALLQFDSSDGKTVIPVETDDSAGRNPYRSGPTALIRKPILDGEFSFSDLRSFADRFEENRGYIDTYMNLMKGLCDPSNRITPTEILLTIVRNFADGLGYATTSFDSMLQLLALKFCSSGEASAPGYRIGASSISARQHILRVAGRIKYVKTKGVGLTTVGTNENGNSNQTISTSKTSEGSSSILSDATTTTSLVETKSSGGTAAFGQRVITRLAGDSPDSESVAQSIFDQIVARSSKSSMSKQEINSSISSRKADLEKFKSKKAEAERELIAIIGLAAFTSIATGGLLTAAGAGAGGVLAASAIQKFKRYVEKIATIESEIKELENLKNNVTTFLQKEAIITSLKLAQEKTTGNLFSQIVKAYDEIIDLASIRLPPDQLMTDADGTTLYGNLDEFGLMSLIVECFTRLASLVKISSEVDSSNNINPKRPIVSVVQDFRNDLINLVRDDGETELGSIECDAAEQIRFSVRRLLEKQQRVQDVSAYLRAFSQVLDVSTDEIITNTSDLLSDPVRRVVIDTERGRKLVESLTTQQIVYRRSLLERYQPIESSGYLPSRVIYSLQEDLALDQLLSSTKFSGRSSENQRIVTVAIPTGLINNEKRYVEKSIGEINRSGMLEVIVGRKDHELDDLIFKNQIFLFDPELFVVPSSFLSVNEQKTSSDQDAALSIAKRLRFFLCDRDKGEFLTYSEIKSNSRYASLTSSQVDEIIRNTTLSYMMETYLFKVCGSIFDESISLEIDDSTSGEGITALSTLSGLNLPDVRLPTSGQILASFGPDGEVDVTSNVNGLTTGDKELLASLTSSMLLRSDRLTDRLILGSKFDRVISIVVDPDDFEIDRQESIRQNGAAARAMLSSLREQGLLVQSDSTIKIRPRDPLSGGFSIGSIYCQFIPHTVSSETGSLLQISMQTLRDRLVATPLVGLTNQLPSFANKSGKTSGSITKAKISSKIPR